MCICFQQDGYVQAVIAALAQEGITAAFGEADGGGVAELWIDRDASASVYGSDTRVTLRWTPYRGWALRWSGEAGFGVLCVKLGLLPEPKRVADTVQALLADVPVLDLTSPAGLDGGPVALAKVEAAYPCPCADRSAIPAA